MGIFDSLFGGEDPSKSTYDNRGMLNKILLGLGGLPGVQAVRNSDAIQDTFKDVNTGALPKNQALQKYGELSGDPKALISDATTPAAIQEYNFLNSLNPDQRKLYFQNKRASQIFDTGDNKNILSPQGEIVQQIPKQLAPEDRPEVKAAQTGAQEQAKLDVSNNASLPTIVQNGTQAVKLIDDILKDPGLSESVGGLGGMRGRQAATLPLTEGQRNFQARADQLKGKAFLEAFNGLRGGGAITEVEGEKATDAQARMSQAQDEKSYRQALTDYQDIIKAGVERAQKKSAGIQNTVPSSATTRKTISFGDLK